MRDFTDDALDPTMGSGVPDDGVDPGSGALTAREVLAILRRRWPVVLAVFAVVVAFGAWRTWRQPRIYQSTATVRFQQSAPPVQGMVQQQAWSWAIDPLQSEQLLIKSQSVAERVANRTGLRIRIVTPVRSRRDVFGDSAPIADANARNEEYRLRFTDSTYSLSSGGNQFGAVPYGTRLIGGGLSLFVPRRPAVDHDVVLAIIPLSSAAGIVRGSLSTRVIPQTDVVEITYRGQDPVVVRDVANAVAQAYSEFSSEMQLTNARNKTQFILSSLDDQKRQLETAQGQLQQFKESHQTSDVSAEVSALFQSIHSFEEQRREAIVEQQVYKQLLGKLTQADTVDDDLRRLGGTDAITKNAYVASLYTRWYDLLKSREELLAGAEGSSPKSPTHPDVLMTDKLINRTKSDLQTASRLYLEGINSRLASFDQTITELRSEAERYPPLESQQARLTADVRTAQTMYDDLLAQYQMARITQSADGATVRVVDSAPLPTFAISPNRTRALVFSAFLGILLGLGLALGLEKLDDSVKSPDELTTRFQLPVLGLIPAIRAATKVGSEAVPLNRLVSHADPRSVVAEAYRSLRTNLSFARAQSAARTLVLTSPGPADGKSTTATNLAITFAQQAQRVLLVDADLRRAVLDKTFQLPRSPGLTEVIVGAATIDDSIHSTSVENLHVMVSGQLPPNPSELLGSPRMREVLAELRERFDVVLFDSPPLLAVTDAAVLSTLVDGVILVVRMGTTARAAVRRATSHLRAVHSRVLGAVLNDVDFTSGSYYGGYGYYYAYGAHDGDGAGNGRVGSLLHKLRKVSGRTGAGSDRG